MEEIARAYHLPPATIGQRVSRAKRTLRDEGASFEVPPREELPQRLPDMLDMLEVVYLVFNEGLRGHRGRGLDAPRAVSRGAAARAGPPGPAPRQEDRRAPAPMRPGLAVVQGQLIGDFAGAPWCQPPCLYRADHADGSDNTG